MIILSEKIFGLLGFAYHRTREGGLKNILNNKFLPGGGDMYGKGAYLTYELDSQLNSNMVSNYGEYIVKFKVNLDKVLIFDKNIQKIVYGKELSLWEQLIRFRVDNKFRDKEVIDIYENELSNVDYSSKVAFQFYDQVKSITKILNGILFTGKNDGLVLVMYNTNNMYPISYCFSDTTKLNEKDLVWNKSIDKNLFKDYMLSVTSGTKDVLQYFDYYEKVDNGFIKIQKKDKWGLLDKNFKEILQPIYDYINFGYLDRNIIKIELNRKYGLLDKNFKEILEPIYNHIDLKFSRDGFIVLHLSNKFGFLSSDFKNFIKPIYDSIDFMYRLDGYIKVKVKDKWVLLDKDLKEIVKPIYDKIILDYNSQGFIFVELNKKTGILNLYGKEIVKPIYDAIDIEYIDMNFIKVLLDNNWGLLNRDGKEIIKPIYRYVSIISKNEIKVINHNNSEETIKI